MVFSYFELEGAEMKKIISILLSALMMSSMALHCFAASSANDDGNSIAYYENSSSWTMTIPAYIQAVETKEFPNVGVLSEDKDYTNYTFADIQSDPHLFMIGGSLYAVAAFDEDYSTSLVTKNTKYSNGIVNDVPYTFDSLHKAQRKCVTGIIIKSGIQGFETPDKTVFPNLGIIALDKDVTDIKSCGSASIIVGYNGTYAESLAKEKGLMFVALADNENLHIPTNLRFFIAENKLKKDNYQEAYDRCLEKYDLTPYGAVVSLVFSNYISANKTMLNKALEKDDIALKAYLDELVGKDIDKWLVENAGDNDDTHFWGYVTMAELAYYLEHSEWEDLTDAESVLTTVESDFTDEEQFVQAEAFLSMPYGEDDNGKAITMEGYINLLKEYADISYYVTLCLLSIDFNIKGVSEEEILEMARQGDEAFAEFFNSYGPFGTDNEGNPLNTVDDVFLYNIGVSAAQLAFRLENGIWSKPDGFDKAVYRDIAFKDVILGDSEVLNMSIEYDNTLADKRGASLDYNLYSENYKLIDNKDIVLQASAGTPEKVFSSKVAAFVEPSVYAGTFLDTIVFSVQTEYVGEIFGIGETLQHYVYAQFNEEYTSVIVSTTSNSDGLMYSSWEANSYGNSPVSPFERHSDTLTSVIISDDVTSISRYAFRGCDSLKFVEIGSEVESIGDYAFCGCSSLEEITLPNSVTTIGERAFSSCTSLTEIVIPNNVTSIGRDAFSYCHSIKQVTLNEGLTTIGAYAFRNCDLITEITIPKSVKSIGSCAFDGCSSLRKITIFEGVTSIDSYAFSSCDLITEIVIPNSVTMIHYLAFYNCKNLKTIKGESGSYAETWANDNGYTFVAI